MQVYRGMDIGTAKPSLDDQALVPHHMIDVVEPEVTYTVAQFQERARGAIDGIAAPIVIAGGSGLHFRAVVDPLEFPPSDEAVRAELDKQSHATLRQRLLELDPDAEPFVDLANPRRVIRAVEIAELTGEVPSVRAQSREARMVQNYQPLRDFVGFGLDCGPDLAEAVAARLVSMRVAGLSREVAELADRLGPTAATAVGYRQLLPVVRGDLDEDQGYDDARRATMALAKRQRTFFRRDPRIRWISATEDAVATIMEALERT